jgi:hypothetical protein
VDHRSRSGSHQDLGDGLRGTPDDAMDDFHNAPLGVTLDELANEQPRFYHSESLHTH